MGDTHLELVARIPQTCATTVCFDVDVWQQEEAELLAHQHLQGQADGGGEYGMLDELVYVLPCSPALGCA